MRWTEQYRLAYFSFCQHQSAITATIGLIPIKSFVVMQHSVGAATALITLTTKFCLIPQIISFISFSLV